jgi:hypothetical protein
MEYRDVQYTLEEDGRGWRWTVVWAPANDQIRPYREKGDRDPQGLGCDQSGAREGLGDCDRNGPRRDFRPPSMSDTRIDFSAPAVLRKWPSVNKQRVCASLGARPYMIVDGTLDECIQQFMLQPESQRHLYEIHAAV